MHFPDAVNASAVRPTPFLTMARKARRSLSNERGSVALMFALMLPVLFGIIGLGVEVGMWFKDRRELQTIADAAAVSAAIEMNRGANQSELETIAQMEADRNGFDGATDEITYVGTPTQGAYNGDDGYVEVIVTRQLNTILSQVFSALTPTTMARAVAGTDGSTEEACVLALSTTAQNAVYINGASTEVSMEGCVIASNSSNASKSINVQNGQLQVDCLWSAGGINGLENIDTVDSCSPTTNGAAVSDPFADLGIPTYFNCDEDPSGNNAYSPSDGETLSEGVYCGGITVNSGDTVTLNSGIYVMDEGDFTVNGGGNITGDNVTIILTASDGSGYGTINISGGATVQLSAPTSEDTTGTLTGDYTAVLFYQDRNAPASPSLDAVFNGGSSMETTGVIYMPNNDISFTGGNAVNNDGCMVLVAQTVTFNGDADIDNECDMYGGNPVTVGSTTGLVE